MTTWEQGLIDMVDERIQLSKRRTVAYGTVQTRDTTGPGATVVFDGTTIAMPVKVPGHVHVLENDRVMLLLGETTWVIVGSFNRRLMAEAFLKISGPGGGGTTTSASFVDMPSTPTIAFNKRYDLTAVRIALKAAVSSSAVATVVETAVRVYGAPGTLTASTYTAADNSLDLTALNVANVHTLMYGTYRDINMPAGTYYIGARWRRVSGGGTLSVDQNDIMHLEADEIYRFTEV